MEQGGRFGEDTDEVLSAKASCLKSPAARARAHIRSVIRSAPLHTLNITHSAMTVTMVPYIDLTTLQTESRNDATDNIDVAGTEDMCRE